MTPLQKYSSVALTKISTRIRQVTMQKEIHSMTGQLCKQYHTKQAALQYNQLGG
jgi:hypothetical protein